MAAGRLVRWVRRILVVLVLLVALLAVTFGWWIHEIGGASSQSPELLATGLSEAARELVASAWEGIDPDRLLDYHVHLVGLGAGGTGASVSPKMRTWWHPLRRIKFEIYCSAAGVTDLAKADEQYRDRLSSLLRGIPRHGRCLLLAFDRHYRPDGTIDDEGTEFHAPNRYSARLAAEHPDLFRAAISVHPYRPDAVEELERWGTRGLRFVKWLPNAMGMDPADPKCDAFYAKMAELDMVLLTHAGDEQAVAATGGQALGNPLRLRRALDAGVKVVVAHCASYGESEDLDDPARGKRSSFELFLRMMGEPRYEGLLFGELSAVIQANRLPRPLAELLKRRDLHGRLVNGSDYPLPAVNVVIRLAPMVEMGVLAESAVEPLREIYDYNPLLFDFVLKRTLRAPGGGPGFPASVFQIHPALDPG